MPMEAVDNSTSQPRPEDIRSGPSRNQTPSRSIPEGGSLPGSVKTQTNLGSAPVGAGNVVTGASPVGEELVAKLRAEVLAERVQRFKAEKTASTSGKCEKEALEDAAKWEQRYIEMNNAYTNKEGQATQLQASLDEANNRKEVAIQAMYNANTERDKYKALRDEAAGERDEARRSFETFKRNFDTLDAKYNESLKNNLALSIRATESNEDYLNVAKKLENTTEALERSRIEAKKIVKIRV
jgi:hypothetical protein